MAASELQTFRDLFLPLWINRLNIFFFDDFRGDLGRVWLLHRITAQRARESINYIILFVLKDLRKMEKFQQCKSI